MLTACSPVKTQVSNQYKLQSFNAKKWGKQHSHQSILISQPDSIAGYQTEQMLYTDKPFELSNFANSAWISSPANMLFPLIVQSIEKTHYFYAVASSPNSDKTDYRLDTQLIELQQNFITKPSVLELAVNVVLTHVEDSRVVRSRIISKRVTCPTDTPLGGVIAANKATFELTKTLSDFVVQNINHDVHHPTPLG